MSKKVKEIGQKILSKKKSGSKKDDYKKYRKLKNSYQKLQKKYDELKSEKTNTKCETSTNETTNIKEEELTKELIDCTKEYKILYEKMRQSSILCGLMEKFDVSTTGDYGEIPDVIHFVAMIGNGVTFAEILYKYLEVCAKPMGKDEIEFCMALNSYYKETFGLNYDVIVCINSNDENKYDKSIMKDISRRNTIYKYFSEVYTPIIMRDMNNIERLAIVKGQN